MVRLHGEFCGDATSTDVITFHHGEIFICPAMAAEQGKRWQRETGEEVLLYGIHGMLHLLGFDDHGSGDYQRMAREQERVLERVLAQPLET